MNTRIQVEHTVTEEITGIDIVKEQIKIAFNQKLDLKQNEIYTRGHAIECRINAEDPVRMLPFSGKINNFHPPGGPGIRVDSHVYTNYIVPTYYDSMIVKIISFGKSREIAIKKMQNALDEIIIEGIKTNIPLHKAILSCKKFQLGEASIYYIKNRLKKLLDI